jgi:hypothetical protein
MLSSVGTPSASVNPTQTLRGVLPRQPVQRDGGFASSAAAAAVSDPPDGSTRQIADADVVLAQKTGDPLERLRGAQAGADGDAMRSSHEYDGLIDAPGSVSHTETDPYAIPNVQEDVSRGQRRAAAHDQLHSVERQLPADAPGDPMKQRRNAEDRGTGYEQGDAESG